MVNRLAIALLAYVVLAGLVWVTLNDPRIRLMTLAILALFAVKTWWHRRDLMPSEGNDGEQERESSAVR
jgi:hypothetical protein